MSEGDLLKIKNCKCCNFKWTFRPLNCPRASSRKPAAITGVSNCSRDLHGMVNWIQARAAGEDDLKALALRQRGGCASRAIGCDRGRQSACISKGERQTRSRHQFQLYACRRGELRSIFLQYSAANFSIGIRAKSHVRVTRLHSLRELSSEQASICAHGRDQCLRISPYQ